MNSLPVLLAFARLARWLSCMELCRYRSSLCWRLNIYAELLECKSDFSNSFPASWLNVMSFGWSPLEALYNLGPGYVDFLLGRGWSAFAVFQPEACHGKFETTLLLMWRFNDLVYISFMRSPGISCWVKMEHRGVLIPWENVLAVRIGLSISTFLPIMLR